MLLVLSELNCLLQKLAILYSILYSKHCRNMAHFYQWLLVSTLTLIIVPWSGAEKDDDEMTEYRFGPRLPIQRIAEANPGKSTAVHGRAPTYVLR